MLGLQVLKFRLGLIIIVPSMGNVININSPQYGKSVTPLLRFFSAKYDDCKLNKITKIHRLGIRDIRLTC